MKTQRPSTPSHGAPLTISDRAREGAERDEWLSLIYNGTHDCMFLMRVDGQGAFTCESVNRSYTSVTGLTEREVVGHKPEEFLPPEAASFVLERYQAAIDAGCALTYAEDILLPAGRVVFETILTPLFDSAGQCTHLLGALRDTTDRKLAEEALQESETRYRQLFESNGSVQFLIDIETAHILDANPAAERFYGWTREQMRTMSAADIVDMSNEEWTFYAEGVSHGIGTAIVRKHRLASGETRTVEVFAGQFTAGSRRVFHSIVHDISDRVRAEEELRDSEARFRSALDNSLDIFTVLDTVRDSEGAIIDFRIVEINARASAALGVDASRMIGRSFGELLPYAANAALLKSLVSVAETGEATETEIQPRVGPLADKWLSCQIVALGRGVAITARDVTDRRRTEDELRALSLVDALTGLFNRRGFEAVAAQHLKAAEHSTKSSLLFYFDMNDFKVINDTWGHAAGDEALVKMAEVLRSTFRESDVIARMGGDEFVALALNCGDGINTVLGRLRTELAHQNARNALNGQEYILETAVGIARFNPETPRSLNTLLAIADRELYEDKRLGERETA
jgi:diguanylate cyclase (GGDEF)-like protein/PAS domain S-box-containing protein